MKDEALKMAHEAGLHIATDVNWMPIIGLEYAEKFAKRVAQHEREACAKQLDALGCDHCAAAIRARSNT